MADRRGKRRRSRLSDDDRAPAPRQNKRRREGYAIPPQPKSPPYPRDVSPDPKPKRKQDFRRREIVAGVLDRIPNRKRNDKSATWPLLEDTWGLLPLPENIANPKRRTMVAWEPYNPHRDRVKKLKPTLLVGLPPTPSKESVEEHGGSQLAGDWGEDLIDYKDSELQETEELEGDISGSGVGFEGEPLAEGSPVPLKMGTRDSEMVIQLMKYGIMEKKYAMTIRDMRKWLDSEREWTVGVGSRQNKWRGSRMLGKGGFGLVGLWERDPLEEGEEDANESVGLPKGLTKVAVKQQMRSYRAFRREGDLQKKLVETGTKHIVGIFPKNDESTVEVIGEGKIKFADPMGKKIGRAFLEFCEGGTLSDLVEKISEATSSNRPLEEKYCWRLLECLAGSTATLEHGNENLKGPSWSTADPTESLVHFDIKPINILVAEKDEKHQKTLILKLADFGLSEPPSVQTFAIKSKGTPGWLAPEQCGEMISGESREYGPSMNIWCMGKVMHFIMNKEKMLPNRDGTVAGKWLFFQPDITSSEMFRTTGYGIVGMPYSVRLLSTVLRMLAIEPKYRIESRELLSICRDSIRLCDLAVAATTTMEGKPLYDAQANLFTINRDQPRHPTTEEIKKVDKWAKNKLKTVENESSRTVRTTATNSNDEESARIRDLAAMNLSSGSKEKIPRSGELIDVLFEAPEPDPMSSVIYKDVAKAESSIYYSVPDFRDV
ncbi:hypothetical protein HYFRA_00001924 [Hymenoscyphus fraxineus]|uniref:Protein kinase domain-containing protein n=1 Tax=Hymenoscyphus fraxineus TaxID=746836 RepID=A0A9N9PJM6_9HELO|nr:hypothetical protein HYFRA_00001924 [Hymenoscyphus fraxineus]